MPERRYGLSTGKLIAYEFGSDPLACDGEITVTL
jgi:hypothetical protein